MRNRLGLVDYCALLVLIFAVGIVLVEAARTLFATFAP